MKDNEFDEYDDLFSDINDSIGKQVSYMGDDDQRGGEENQQEDYYDDRYDEEYDDRYDDQYEDQYDEEYEDNYDGTYDDEYDDRYSDEYNDEYDEYIDEEGYSYEDEYDGRPVKKRMAGWKKALITIGSIFGVLVIAIGVYFGVVYGKINIDNKNNVVYQTDSPDDMAEDGCGEELDVDWTQYDGVGKHVDGIYNILILAEENMDKSNVRGRSDVMMVLTIDTVANSLKLTSLMRDMYVQQPGYTPAKLNAAYRRGDVKLVKETIALNFDLAVDAYVLLNYESFEKVIDQIGGVEITLSEAEAKYLNTTNYISEKSNRNVKAGKNTLNGNQALGYCRIRYVATINGTKDDYGRTERQRNVMSAIFNKCKSLSIGEMNNLISTVFTTITTDITALEAVNLGTKALGVGATELETFRVPISGGWYDETVSGAAVLVPYLEKNTVALHNFIFGSKSSYLNATSSSEATSSSTSTQ